MSNLTSSLVLNLHDHLLVKKGGGLGEQIYIKPLDIGCSASTGDLSFSVFKNQETLPKLRSFGASFFFENVSTTKKHEIKYNRSPSIKKPRQDAPNLQKKENQVLLSLIRGGRLIPPPPVGFPLITQKWHKL